jgi:CelD/BcsL family acetyltransferase involved in cellulose biosynthesis
MYPRIVTTHAPDAEPACPATPASLPIDAAPSPLRVARCPFDAISRETWDRLVARNPWATPFSGWAFQRAWWDAYQETAHDQTLVVTATTSTPGGHEAGDIVAIVPLMHRHEVEPGDAETATRLRHGEGRRLTPVLPTAKAVFFGASYHADYATVLAAPEDLPAVAAAVVAHLEVADADPDHPSPWDVVDLRRLRCGDPTAEAMATAFGEREISAGWTLNVEREDVCPVVIVPDGLDFEGYLGTVDKKARHEVRRKLRRAEAAGEIVLAPAADPVRELDDVIDLHQKRWGDAGLFPPTPGGDASRVFIRRLFEESGPDGPARLLFLSVGGRRIAAAVHFEDMDGVLFYNAGIDPDARELSPGVILAAACIRWVIESGRHRLDFLRGDEPYKYEWGGVDEPVMRILVRRSLGA